MPYSAHSLAIVCDIVVMAALADCMCETHQFWPRRKLPMATLFQSFEPKPVGAASIAQAHRATLAGSGERVIVKVQYPEVATLYAADFGSSHDHWPWSAEIC